jgi:hypothetical protein
MLSSLQKKRWHPFSLSSPYSCKEPASAAEVEIWKKDDVVELAVLCYADENVKMTYRGERCQ